MKKRRKAVGIVVCILLLAAWFTGCQRQAQRGESPVPPDRQEDSVTIRVGSLKGPTSMGILFLMEKAVRGETADEYTFQMAAGADELVALMAKGELDIALIPANVAAVLYGRMDGGVAVLDINTLGVLYIVTGSDEIESVADLKGKTISLTGKGMIPEASLRYIMEGNGLSKKDYVLDFRSEPTEVAAVLAEEASAVGLLPQPFATAALMQNEALRISLDLDEEWSSLGDGSPGMVTGVTIVRRAFLEEYPDAVTRFLEEHLLSAAAINDDVETGAALAVQAGIVAKEPMARSAIPQCGITCVTGQEMKEMLSAYLQVLENFDADLVGGRLPGEDFYYSRGQ